MPAEKLLQLEPPKFTWLLTRRRLTPLRQPDAGCALMAMVWVPVKASTRTQASIVYAWLVDSSSVVFGVVSAQQRA